jgi:hypothetical protein
VIRTWLSQYESASVEEVNRQARRSA